MSADLPGAGQPQDAATGPTPDPLNEFRDPTNHKFFGKWDTPDAAKKGMSDLLNYSSQVKTEAETYKALLAQQGRVDPTARAADRHSATDELKAWGVPTEPLNEMMRETARAEARSAFEPIMKTIEARNRMLSEFPEYAQREGEVMGLVQSNPAFAETFNQIAGPNPYAGLRFAWAMFRENAANTARTQDAATEAAKTAASLPGGGGGAGMSRVAATQGQTQETLEKALAEAMRTRDPVAQADFFGHYLGDRPLLWGEKPSGT